MRCEFCGRTFLPEQVFKFWCLSVSAVFDTLHQLPRHQKFCRADKPMKSVGDTVAKKPQSLEPMEPRPGTAPAANKKDTRRLHGSAAFSPNSRTKNRSSSHLTEAAEHPKAGASGQQVFTSLNDDWPPPPSPYPTGKRRAAGEEQREPLTVQTSMWRTCKFVMTRAFQRQWGGKSAPVRLPHSSPLKPEDDSLQGQVDLSQVPLRFFACVRSHSVLSLIVLLGRLPNA